MKFIVDQQLPPALVRWLHARGNTAEHVRDIGLRDADDAAIWAHAVAIGALILSKDQDFAERRARVASGPTVVWLRIGNTTTEVLLERLDSAWADVEAALATDASVSEVR